MNTNLENIPQALFYMLANLNQDQPVFGLLTNGSNFNFLKIIKLDISTYALSDKFSRLKRENELYKFLQILKK